jgi:hypothetical protein
MDKKALIAEAQKHIDAAAKHDIKLELKDFTVHDGDLYLDGMDPKEWIDAMTMD